MSNNNQRNIPSDNQQEQASNGKSNASTAQPPKRLIDDVKVNNHVDSIGKAPEKAPSRG